MAATAAVHRVDVAAAGEPAAGATAATRHAEDAATWPRTIGHLAVRLVPGWIAVWALIVGLGLVLTGPARGHWPLSVEDDVSQGLEVARTSLWDSITFGLGWLGATAPVVGCALVSAVVLRRTLRRWAEPVFVLAAPLGQSVVFFFTQLLIERERPDVERLDDSPPTSSFPSGHSSAAMALWWALALICHRVIKPRPLRTAAVLFFALLPLGVVAARLYRGMHHPSDIAASLVNASLILLLTDRVVRGTAFPAVDVRTESAQDTPENGPASGPTRASGNRPADDPSRRPSIASSGGSLGEPEGGSLGEPEGGSLDRAVGEPLGGRARADGAEEVLG